MLMLVGACARQRFRTVEAVTNCATRSAPTGNPTTASGVSAWRAGRYRLAQVITSLPPGRAPFIYTGGELRLASPTAEQLAASKVRSFGHPSRRDLRFVGTWTEQDYGLRDTAEVDGDTLYLGLRYGLDVSPTAVVVTGMADRRVWGTWRDPQSGYVFAVDPVSHEPFKEMAGLFCAEWLGL